MSRTRIVKGKITEIIKGDYNIYSASNIVNNAAIKVMQKGVEDGVSYGDPEFPPLAPQPIKAIIQFRPKVDWKGEFGFDWFRLGDTQLFMDKKFKDIVAYQYEEETFITKETNGNKYEGFFKKDEEMFSRLKRKYSPFSIPWKQIRNTEGIEENLEYYIPWLSLLKDEEAQITFFAEIEEGAEYIAFPESEFFTFTPNRIEVAGRTNINLGAEEITIKCIREFNTDKTLEIKAYKTGEGGVLVEAIAGKLKVWANDTSKQKEKNVVFVRVKTPELIPSEGSRTPEINDEKERINMYLKQAYIKLSDNSNIVTLDLTDPNHNFIDFVTNNQVDSQKTSGGLSLTEYLKAKLENQYPGMYQNHFKAFYFAENGYNISGGYLSGYSQQGSDFVVVFISKNDQTAAHEFLHSMNLSHTFTNIEASPNALFTYQYRKTDNLMDYSHHFGNDNKRCSLYYWQWIIANRSIT